MRIKIFILFLFINFASAQANSLKKSNIVALQVNLSSKGTDISFDKKKLKVKFGKTIQLTYSNQAEPGSEITHNVAVVKLGQEESLNEALKKFDYDLDKISNDFFVAKTKVLNPGEMETITFKPDSPGVYTYICLMPSHGNMLGMKGYLEVYKESKK